MVVRGLKGHRHPRLVRWSTKCGIKFLDQVWCRCDHKHPESSHLVPLSNHHSQSSAVILGKGPFQTKCSCAACPILRIDHIQYGASKPSFLQDLTHLSDLYFQVILPCLVFDQDTKSFHCFVGRILALLLYIFLQVDRVHRTMYSKLPLKFFLLPFMGNLLYSEIAAIPLEVSVLLVLEDVPLCHFWEYSTIFWMSILASVAVLEVRRIEFTEYAVLFRKQIRRLDCETQYDVLIRRFDTLYPTNGYGVSGDQSE
ncbi:hypothetical protein Tco_0360380 [Tanacetum coccineum]